MQRKIIEMLASAKTDQAEYAAGEIYSVPAAVADRFVQEKVAKYIEVSLDEPDEDDDEPPPEYSEKPWRETLRAGDIFQWQITLNLPHFDKPRIDPKFHPDAEKDNDNDKGAGITEVGGDGREPSAAQAKAIEYLLEHEAALYPQVLSALARYAQEFRSDWESTSPQLAEQVVPPQMTPDQAAERIAFDHVYISARSRDGIAYIEMKGNCCWDPEHGFSIVLHQDRIVEVTQQGSGWSDAQNQE
jgi:hypothetical protein